MRRVTAPFRGSTRVTVPTSISLDGKEFFAAVTLIEKEKGIPRHYMLEKITQALVSAYKRDHEGVTDNVFVEANEITETVRMYVKKEIVEEVTNPATEIALAEARKSLPSAQSGDVVRIEIKPRNFGRIAAQTAKQVVIQGIREAERGVMYESYSSKAQELLTGTVLRIDPATGDMFIRVGQGSEAYDAVLRASEQIPGARPGDPPDPSGTRWSEPASAAPPYNPQGFPSASPAPAGKRKSPRRCPPWVLRPASWLSFLPCSCLLRIPREAAPGRPRIFQM